MMNMHTSKNALQPTKPKHPVNYRLAREEDLPKLEWFGEYTHFRKVFAYAYQEQLARRRCILLAIVDDFPIGQIFISIRANNALFAPDNRRGYFYSFRVRQDFRGQGIGSELIKRAENILIERRRRYATLSVAKNNPDAKRLYERHGYYIVSEDEGQWSYTDHEGQIVEVHEPCWMLEKRLILPSLEPRYR